MTNSPTTYQNMSVAANVINGVPVGYTQPLTFSYTTSFLTTEGDQTAIINKLITKKVIQQGGADTEALLKYELKLTGIINLLDHVLDSTTTGQAITVIREEINKRINLMESQVNALKQLVAKLDSQEMTINLMR